MPTRPRWSAGRLAPASLGLAAFLVATPQPAIAEWYLAGYLGGATTSDGTLTFHDAVSGARLEFAPVTFDGRSFESPLYYGVRAGLGLPHASRLAIEVELIHLKVYADGRRATASDGERARLPMPALIQSFSISHGLNFLLVNAVVRQPLGRAGSPLERLRLTGRLGAGLTIPHGESTVRGQFREGYELGGAGWQVAGGVDWAATRRVMLLAEYKLTGASPQVTVAGGDVESRVRSHHLVAGLGFLF